MRALVLNASYEPIGTVCWQKAFTLVFSEKADLIEAYDKKIRSPNAEFETPAVIRIRRYVNMNWVAKFSRKSVYNRDNHKCQYCGSKFDLPDLTFDHVHPRARGGKTSWDNIVTACKQCNNKKGDKSLSEIGMRLLREPYEPTHRSALIQDLKQSKDLPSQWEDYIF